MSEYRLSNFLAGRDNNFTLLRFAAASAVFISHCSSLTGGSEFTRWGWLGYMAVNAFFIISGFLVTKSLFQRQDLVAFIVARVLRIYPALVLAVAYTVLVGLWFAESATNYLSDSRTLEFVFKNTTQYTIFTPPHLPIPEWGKANAPLWTLSFELQAYALLAGFGFLFLYFKQTWLAKWVAGLAILFVLTNLALYAVDYTYSLKEYSFGYKDFYFRFIAIFGLGSFGYLLRHKIHLRLPYLLAAIGVIALLFPFKDACLSGGVFTVFTQASLAYLILYLAYIPAGVLRSVNKLGDYSYGIYIFGYPTQQAAAHLYGDLNMVELFLICFPITLFISVLSWHFVEQRFLKLKSPQ